MSTQEGKRFVVVVNRAEKKDVFVESGGIPMKVVRVHLRVDLQTGGCSKDLLLIPLTDREMAEYRKGERGRRREAPEVSVWY